MSDIMIDAQQVCKNFGQLQVKSPPGGCTWTVI